MSERPVSPQADALRRALSALERMQARLTAVQDAAREPIAVVGLGCRFPGTEGPEAFARFLESGGNSVGDLPAERAEAAEWAGTAALRKGGFFADIAGFDAEFFGIGEAEALAMDPHQRLLLEVAWEALEDAGAAGGTLAGTRTGVYLGLGAQNSDYAYWLLNDPQGPHAQSIGGSFHSLMPGRLSYLLDLRGPSLVVDAACASGLVGVHLACQALRRGECEAALAGAVNLVLSPLVSRAVDESGLFSPSGSCRSFDARADGFVRGEGGAVLVLKRHSDAVASGDAVWALIHGSAVGQDGHSNGLTAPNGPAQEALLRRALAESGLDPGALGYVEAHATGTPLGDAIEAQALAAVYAGAGREPLLVGAVKPNLGHLEAASGMAALVKAMLALYRRRIPPTLYPRELNPEIAPDETNLRFVTATSPWPEGAPYAGVSAFGMSGTNAHTILGPAPDTPASETPDGPRVLMLSAPSEPALRTLASRIADGLTPEMGWHDVCASLNTGRKAFPTRMVVEAKDIASARAQLRAYAEGGQIPEPRSELARAAASGVDPDWIAQQGAPVRRLRLPTSPFRRRHFWPKGTAYRRATPSSEADLLHRLQWRSRPATRTRAPDISELLLTGDPALARRLQPALERAGFRTSLLAADEDGRPCGSVAWRRLLEAGAPGTLIYCSGGDSVPAPDQLREQQKAALAPLLHLVRALAEQEPRRLVLVGQGAWEGATAAAMALTLGRSIALEHPELGCRRIDLAPALADPGGALAEELATEDGEEWVRLVPGDRLVPRLQTLRAAARHFVARPDAAYLITGGMGGIGRALAGWLVAKGARELLLIGRSARALPERSTWEAEGVRVRTATADVADLSALEAIIAGLDREGIPLAGVFHLAGVSADELLSRQDWRRFSAALRAKAEGAATLHQITRDRPLDHFVLFSSITALCGLAGTGAYAAANGSLGALARARRNLGLPALNILWGTWEGSGMVAAAGTELSAQWEEHGIHAFTPDCGFSALEALLASGHTEAVAARADWARLARWARQEGSGSELYVELVRETSLPRPAAPTSRSGKTEDLQALVRGTLAELLERPPEDPALYRPFGELGLGSLTAVELRNRLAERLGIPIPATLAFNHPSLAAVVRFLAGRLGSEEEVQRPTGPAGDIDQLTEAEAEQRLGAVLADLEK